jgi:hypothetical protein
MPTLMSLFSFAKGFVADIAGNQWRDGAWASANSGRHAWALPIVVSLRPKQIGSQKRRIKRPTGSLDPPP